MPPKKVLIVDDEALIAEDLRSQLEELGYEIAAVAASVRDAVKAAKETTPDIVLMDIKLKGELDGVDAARIIQKYLDPKTKIIFLTARPRNELVDLDEVGSYVFLNKPFDKEQLLRALSEEK